MEILYRHTKSGKLYEFVTIAEHTETHEKLVVYKDFAKTEQDVCRMWARPDIQFFGYVKTDDGELVHRFTKIDHLSEVFTDEEIKQMKDYYEKGIESKDKVTQRNIEKYGKYIV